MIPSTEWVKRQPQYNNHGDGDHHRDVNINMGLATFRMGLTDSQPSGRSQRSVAQRPPMGFCEG